MVGVVRSGGAPTLLSWTAAATFVGQNPRRA